MIDLKVGDDTDFNAKMTNRQVRSLHLKMDKKEIYRDLDNSSWIDKVSGKSGGGFDSVKKWIMNGWSTENLLSHNSNLDGDALQASIHWSFPQAYYSIYAHIQALIIGLGHSDRTHTTVRKRFGRWVKMGRYPDVMSFHADGGRYDIKLQNISGKRDDKRSVWFEEENADSHDHQISQFLSKTREIHLKDKREEMKEEFTTQSGDVRKRLEREHWREVSDSLGPTTLIDLIYRKRIKSNYRDVDTYHSSDLKPRIIVEGLKHVVECSNFVHECVLMSLFGKNKVLDIASEASKSIGIDMDRMDKAIDICYN